METERAAARPTPSSSSAGVKKTRYRRRRFKVYHRYAADASASSGHFIAQLLLDVHPYMILANATNVTKVCHLARLLCTRAAEGFGGNLHVEYFNFVVGW